MDYFSLVFLFFTLLLISVVSFLLFRLNRFAKKSKDEQFELSELRSKLKILDDGMVKLESEKQKFEEKNKKLWSMSEVVHKERRKVDEALEMLTSEKEKLLLDKKKLDEKVKKLWQTSTAIHKEKERINELKQEIEQKHQEIIDSVTYAKRIQHALLASDKMLNENLEDYFLLFLPRDIVSGDFYWAAKKTSETGNKFYLAVCDSTGHGVPGAIMSILNISCLNEAVNKDDVFHPHHLLDYTRTRVMEHMANDGSAEGGKDGMDAVLACFDFENKKLDFAAANNPLWLIRNDEKGTPQLLEFKPDKMPVGKAMGEIKTFSLQSIDLQKGDLIILLTDGYPDQFGGPANKKFMYRRLKDSIMEVFDKSPNGIKDHLLNIFNAWKGNAEQVDDVLIFGIRVT